MLRSERSVAIGSKQCDFYAMQKYGGHKFSSGDLPLKISDTARKWSHEWRSNCEVCGTEFTHPDSLTGARLCSPECSQKYFESQRTHPTITTHELANRQREAQIQGLAKDSDVLTHLDDADRRYLAELLPLTKDHQTLALQSY